MADLVYRKVMHDLKARIFKNEFNNKRLPDERSLSESYGVSRSSIKRALNVLAQQGIIFKKRGSGTFINPLYLKNQSLFNYEGTNLGVTDSFHLDGKTPTVKLLDYQVVPASKEMQQDLFLNDNDFVYQIKRLRLFDDKPIIIETGYIPIKIVPALTRDVVEGSIFNYLEDIEGKSVTKSFLSILAEPSNKEDQKLLGLTEKEPVGIMEGIFFLDDGTPFEVSNMRLHYKYLKYNTFVSLSEE
ncbi:GntR family transcriptional regulator [Paucilactobacillus hokkaidonensis JCM 18461]|uniref:GntR family transcriptional regulator n=2 Tax=Paucilactobacillus hokkaidonensis TaxID=1193095 RepID=A0A0A1GWT3_9LACO|nr:GntR family transcriptional regulator [Paucilactobacillus hokkaidonensis]KRO11126.1 GntR family transcriptional regulator [Paucilactobacillus hokkaidonensis]BAP86510.1 GntR family transcriptional regulator [Paucilactobacillus hokkaidonensis JCM 18461]